MTFKIVDPVTQQEMYVQVVGKRGSVELRLKHQVDDKPVAEVVLDFYNDKIQMLLFPLDESAVEDPEASYYHCDHPSQSTLITTDWPKYKPKGASKSES